jgi:hypothetical protein
MSRIYETNDYRRFVIDHDNRAIHLKKYKKLYESMRMYGWIECFPMGCVKRETQLIVKDGQHRLAIAEELNLRVLYVVVSIDFDIGLVNCTSQKWTLVDFADKHAKNGIEDYTEGLVFASQHSLPIGAAFSLLAGTTSFTNISVAFYSGQFRVKDRDWADLVASTYKAMTTISSDLQGARFLEACMAVGRVQEFDASRLIRAAERCREKLVSFATRDGFLQMMEDVDNFRRKELVPLRVQAEQVMRSRSATKRREPVTRDQ